MNTVVWDLDDTLITTSRFYHQKRQEVFSLLAQLGLDITHAAAYIDAIEAKGIEKYGFQKPRFPLSLANLYTKLAEDQNQPFDPFVRWRCESIGWSVFEVDHPVNPQAEITLRQLRNRGYRQILFTKGDREVQQLKLLKTGLDKYFDHIEIALYKNVEQFANLLFKLQAVPEETVMIGDSIRSDINPALALGMHAIYVPALHVWQYEVATPAAGYHQATNLFEALQIIEQLRERYLRSRPS